MRRDASSGSASNALDVAADNREARAAADISLPPLNMLVRQHTLSEEEVAAGCSLPLQRRVTTQMTANHVPGRADRGKLLSAVTVNSARLRTRPATQSSKLSQPGLWPTRCWRRVLATARLGGTGHREKGTA